MERSDSGSGKGGAKRRAAQAKRGSLGKLLAGARGGAPLRSFVPDLLQLWASEVIYYARYGKRLNDPNKEFNAMKRSVNEFGAYYRFVYYQRLAHGES